MPCVNGGRAGVILFGGNIESPEQVRELTRALRQAGGRPIVSVDQEGGAVRRIPWAPPVASEPQQAATGTAGLSARKAAVALRRLGITVSLAPVADVPSVPGSVMAARSFSSDPAVTSRSVAAAVCRLERRGRRLDREALPGARRSDAQHRRGSGCDQRAHARSWRRPTCRRSRPRSAPACRS